MLNSVYGRLEYVMSNRAIISTRLGLEFDIIISSRTASHLLNIESKEDVRLLVVLQHREDAILLYGFLTEAERDLYNELININGIGAKQALKILSAMSVDEFISCLNDTNIKLLSSIPGMGLKTAQRIILALRDKLVSIEKKPSLKQKSTALFQNIQESLQDMGFEKADVKLAVEKCAAEISSSQFSNSAQMEEELFRRAFTFLSKSK